MRKICELWPDSLHLQANGGIGSALNMGITAMKGIWFTWLSSDDVLMHNTVEELLRFAREKDAKFVYSDYVLIDNYGNKVREFIEPTYNTYLDYASSLWQKHIGNGSSVLIYKSVLEQVGLFDTSLKFGEDYDFWLRACILHGIMLYRCPQILLK